MGDLNLIAAVSRNGVIGKNGKMPWCVPEDLRWFREQTVGHPVIMGRKTYESIGKPLANRSNIVITSRSEIPGCYAVASLDEALLVARGFLGVPTIIGGGSIYSLALPRVTKMLISEIDQIVVGADTYFPKVNWNEWELWVYRKGETPGLVFREFRRKA